MSEPHFTVDELDLIEAVCQSQMQIWIDSGSDPLAESGYGSVDGADTVEDATSMLERIVAKLHGVTQKKSCPDCGEEGESRGHYGCQYPSDDPEIEGLEDPMERER